MHFDGTHTTIATVTCQRKADSNPYLVMLHDTRVASPAKLWPHNSTDMTKQCPKIFSNSKLHILRFNPHLCSLFWALLSAWMHKGRVFVAQVKAQLSPTLPTELQLCHWCIWDRSCLAAQEELPGAVAKPTPPPMAEHLNPAAANPHEQQGSENKVSFLPKVQEYSVLSSPVVTEPNRL